MSFVADIVSSAADAVGGAVGSIASTVGRNLPAIAGIAALGAGIPDFGAFGGLADVGLVGTAGPEGVALSAADIGATNLGSLIGTASAEGVPLAAQDLAFTQAGTLGTGVTSPTLGALGAAPQAVSGATGGPLSGVADFLGTNLGSVKNPITIKDIGGSLMSAVNLAGLSQRLGGVAQTAMQANQPLNAPQRQPYQQQLSQLLTNPQAFYSTNPVVQGQLDLAKRQFDAASASKGTGGTQFMDFLKQVQDIASGTFNTQANLLSQLGGFTMPTFGAGQAFAQPAMLAAGAGGAATSALGYPFGLGQPLPQPTDYKTTGGQVKTPS